MSHAKWMSSRRTSLLAALLVSAAAGAARAVPPAVLDQVPGDAYGVTVINNIKALGTKVANAGTRLDLPVPPDPVGYVTRSIGIAEGFDANSSAALVLLKPAADKADQPYITDSAPPPAVILLPTTNAKTMMEPFKPSDPDAKGISEVSLPDNPEQHGYVVTVADKWVAIAQKKEDLIAYLNRGDSFTKTASPATLKVFDANDLVIWGDVPKLSAGSDKWLDDRETDLTGMLELQNQVGKGDAFQGAIAHAATKTIFDFAHEFLKDTRADMFSMRLTDSGATFGMSGEFQPDSPIGKFVAAQGGLGPVTFEGLPNGNYLFAASMKANAESLKAPLAKFIDLLESDATLAKDQRLPDLKKALEISEQEVGLIQGMAFVLLDPAAGGKNGFLNGAIVIDTSDPQKLMNLQLQSVNSALAQESMSADLKQTVTVSQNAVNIKGVSLTKVAIKVALRDETPDNPITPENKAAAEVVQQVYGPDGMVIYMGVAGKRVLVIYGSDAATLESSVAAASANTDELDKSKEIAGMKDELVDHPVGVMYLPIARWVGLAPMIAGPALGLPAQAPAAPAKPVPPMVISLGVNGTTMTGELHLPIATITGVQEAVKQMQESAQNGNNAAPNPGAP